MGMGLFEQLGRDKGKVLIEVSATLGLGDEAALPPSVVPAALEVSPGCTDALRQLLVTWAMLAIAWEGLRWETDEQGSPRWRYKDAPLLVTLQHGLWRDRDAVKDQHGIVIADRAPELTRRTATSNRTVHLSVPVRRFRPTTSSRDALWKGGSELHLAAGLLVDFHWPQPTFYDPPKYAKLLTLGALHRHARGAVGRHVSEGLDVLTSCPPRVSSDGNAYHRHLQETYRFIHSWVVQCLADEASPDERPLSRHGGL